MIDFQLIEIILSFLSNKLLSILNILCNNTQNTSIQQRDACYGCFFRAGSLPPGNVQLVSLSQCATIYLNNTGYQQCAAQLQVSGFRWDMRVEVNSQSMRKTIKKEKKMFQLEQFLQKFGVCLFFVFFLNFCFMWWFRGVWPDHTRWTYPLQHFQSIIVFTI